MVTLKKTDNHQQMNGERCDLYKHTHKPEYESVIKKNEILPFATTWMDLEGTLLSEMSQMEKDK